MDEPCSRGEEESHGFDDVFLSCDVDKFSKEDL
jgi:hypothetical protein